ncbi:phasin family protein [Croceicoccus sp. Ery15]|uniref:phasin family protein n=1 Tax=Croceicoccus sp. Ery15 TaxID=1703338 RepID=UPI0027150200|nr:phasin family protein [Croceicoccus sp. Ery15]
MADDKQDSNAAKAYEAAAGKLADETAKSPSVKAEAPKAEAKNPAPEKAGDKKAPAATKADKKAAEPVKAPEPAPAKAEVAPVAPKPVAKKAAPKKAAVKKAAVKKAAPKKPVAKKPAARKPVAKKPAPVAAKPATKPVSGHKEEAPLAAKTPANPAPAKPASFTPVAPAKIKQFTQEFVTMTDAEMMTKSFQNAMSEMTAKSQDAYKKGSEMFKEAGEFTKGNFEAMVESSKIFAAGMQEMGKAAVADSKAEFEALTAEVKEMASVKSPTDFFQLQSALLRKNFDKAVAMSSKNTEAMLKLANDATQPLSTRVSLAMEKIKAA